MPKLHAQSRISASRSTRPDESSHSSARRSGRGGCCRCSGSRCSARDSGRRTRGVGGRGTGGAGRSRSVPIARGQALAVFLTEAIDARAVFASALVAGSVVLAHLLAVRGLRAIEAHTALGLGTEGVAETIAHTTFTDGIVSGSVGHRRGRTRGAVDGLAGSASDEVRSDAGKGDKRKNVPRRVAAFAAIEAHAFKDVWPGPGSSTGRCDVQSPTVTHRPSGEDE